MKRNIVAAVLAFTLIESASADLAIERAQAALKAQGFYYGELSGKKNADTTAAIRRFQIRNGLQVTGELNQETLRALQSSSGSAQAPTPSPRPTLSREAPPTGQSAEPIPSNTPAQRGIPNTGITPPSAQFLRGPFSGTPYGKAPLTVQRRVIIGAQGILRRAGYYRGAMDGTFTSQFEFSLRAYQSHRGLPPTGHFDLNTLAALGLLPAQPQPGFQLPARRLPPPPLIQPPVRGEWIHEDGND